MGLGSRRHKKQWDAEEQLQTIALDIDQKPQADSKEDILEILNDMIDKHAEDFYMDVNVNISKEDIEEVAHELDPFLGRLSMYSYATSSVQEGDGEAIPDAYAGVNFTFERSIESFVYDDLRKDIPIPEDNAEALKVKQECELFLKENISIGMTDFEKELAIHDYIINNCYYSTSFADDMSEYNSYGCLVNRKCVCEGYARTSALLMKLSGVECKLISGKGKGELAYDGAEQGHMWNQVKINGVWYHYDATWDDPRGSDQILTHLYMNVSDQIMSLDHEWEQDKYEQCISMTENYYMKNGMYFDDDTSFQQYVKDQLSAGERQVIKCCISNLDLSEETMYFIFDYDGISSYQISTMGLPDYQYLEIHIN